MTTKPILYSFRRCPYAIRARLALLVSETDCELREVKLSAKPEALLAASAKGTVPVLVLPSGEVLDESLDIMRWALGRSDPQGWRARDDRSLLAENDGPFKHHLDRYKYPDRYGVEPMDHRIAGLSMLEAIELRLEAGPYLHGDRCSLTDAAILPFVRQFATVDRPWFDAQALPRTRRWLDAFVTSALFGAAMERFDPWRPGDAALSLIR